MRGTDEQQLVGCEERDEAQGSVVEKIDEAGAIGPQFREDRADS